MIRITLLRHGHSEADELGVHEGRLDSALTPLGRQQATQRAETWHAQGRQFDRLFSSPLKRARTCADILAKQLNLDVIVRNGLMERDNGILAGLAFTESRHRYPKPDVVTPFQPYVVSAGNGESYTELYCRAALELQYLVRQGDGASLVVSHGAFLNAMMNVICGNQPRANESGLVFQLGDLAFIDTCYDAATDTWIIEYINP
ncbi:histidine phosphatase family protein [Photobacterium sp. MCCC 1A19761]|uniref:histidine phosphatase family protein n=1 Tax=Photobacterium sp. MCCC 1A19761 TaxID=3115000 RepID=UPI00307D8EDE